MLSEHEILELLEQLKIGSLTGQADDPVGHWPILIGDGLCLNLQCAASGEFARQPDKVTVKSGLAVDTTLGDICSRYRQIHHLSTGLHDRSLLIGYNSHCLALLPRLHMSGSNPTVTAHELDVDLSCAYDFSVAIAASLDPSMYGDHDVVPVAFLPLELGEDTPFTGGWVLALQLGSRTAEFFIGLLNPAATRQEDQPLAVLESAVIQSVPRSISRSSIESEIVVQLSMPDSLEMRRADHLGSYVPDIDASGVVLHRISAAEEKSRSAKVDLIVQKSLQLSVDDLYLLLVEAIGSGEKLSIQFVPGLIHCESGMLNFCRLPHGTPLRVLTVNDLPVRNASIVVEEGQFLLKSCE